MNAVLAVMFYLVPLALLFAAARFGWSWFFLLPLVGWPVLFFGGDRPLWLPLLIAAGGVGAVGLGLLFRRPREEPQS